MPRKAVSKRPSEPAGRDQMEQLVSSFFQIIGEDEPLFRRFRTLVCIETNGTQPVPGWVEWITVSPKNELPLRDIVPIPSELKFVFEPEHIPDYLSMQDADCEKRIQPLARRDGTTNLREALEFVLAHPRFKLSVQLHKLIGVR